MSTSNIGANLQSSNVDEGTAEAAVEAYRFIKMGTTQGTVTPCTAITDIAIGVSRNKAAIGERVEYQTRGIALVQCKTALTLHAEVMPAASEAGKASDASGATARSAGVCLQATTTDGQVVAVAINLPNLKGPANS